VAAVALVNNVIFVCVPSIDLGPPSYQNNTVQGMNLPVGIERARVIAMEIRVTKHTTSICANAVGSEWEVGR
jgi:hypothetical protein